MAHMLPIAEVVERKLTVLLDANVLINAFPERATGGPLRSLIAQIDLNRRFALELVFWEFLHPKKVTREEIRDRRRWLKQLRVKPLRKRPGGYVDSFMNLVRFDEDKPHSGARGDAVDNAQLACSIASRRTSALIVVASGDTDLTWPKDATLVTEFLAN